MNIQRGGSIGRRFNVKQYGATGLGVADDIAAYRAAVSDCIAQGGGEIFSPYGEYLWNSLQSVTVGGAAVSLCLHIPAGGSVRFTCDPGTVIRRGSSINTGAMIGLAEPDGSGGPAGYLNSIGYTFNAAAADEQSVTCATAAQAGNFAAGDIVYLEGTLPLHNCEINYVVSANATTGVIVLRHPLTWDFAGATRKIHKVTNLTNKKVIFEGLIFKNDATSMRTIFGSQAVGVEIRGCEFYTTRSPLSIGTLRGAIFEDNYSAWTAETSGVPWGPQGGSMDVDIVKNRLVGNTACIGVGEGAAHWKVLGNKVTTIADAALLAATSAIGIGDAMHVDIDDNEVLFSGADANYPAINGQQSPSTVRLSITKNKIKMIGSSGNYAIKTGAPGAIVTGNDIWTSRSGIWSSGLGTLIEENFINLTVGTGLTGININVTAAEHGCSVIANRIKAASIGTYGIRVSDDGAQTSPLIINGNTVDNFTNGITAAALSNEVNLTVLGNDVVNCTLPYTAGMGASVIGVDTLTQGQYRISRVVSKTGIADNTATPIFTITTVNESGSNDGGAYTCEVEATIGHNATSIPSDGAVKKWKGSFCRFQQAAGTGVNGAVEDIFSGTSVASTPATRDIGTITMTVAETSEYVQTVSFQIDLTGSAVATAQIECTVKLTFIGFLTPPAIAAA